jgi:hypothetical protein
VCQSLISCTFAEIPNLPRGQELAKLFTDVGLHVVVKDLSAGASSGKGRPNTFELWFGTAAVPASCAGEGSKRFQLTAKLVGSLLKYVVSKFIIQKSIFWGG